MFELVEYKGYTILEKTGESEVQYKIKTNWGVEGYICWRRWFVYQSKLIVIF